MILGGDIGGTKTLLALADVRSGSLQRIRERRYDNAGFPDFEAILSDFLADRPAIDAACFGVAGPITGETARLTYLPWLIDGTALQHRFALGTVSLLNDFAVAAHGLSTLTAENLLTLQTGEVAPQAPRIVLGAGTGLGVAGLVWADSAYRVIPGEGGHFGFAPQTEEQAELWRWVFVREGRVTIEDLVSGAGLSRIFAFFSGRPCAPAEISQAALAGHDPHAVSAVRLWLACLGGFAGDLAMQWLAQGGVYLAGGMAAKMLPHLDPSPFLEAFRAKRQHRDLVERMPIHLVREEDLGLRGALACAARTVQT